MWPTPSLQVRVAREAEFLNVYEPEAFVPPTIYYAKVCERKRRERRTW